MKLLVCGGRAFTDRAFAFKVLDRVHESRTITLVIQGGAKGADRLASDWAIARNIKQQCFPALWDVHGNSAGPIRNQQMLDEGRPKGVVAFPGGEGTADMVERALKAGIPVYRPKYEPEAPPAKPTLERMYDLPKRAKDDLKKRYGLTISITAATGYRIEAWTGKAMVLMPSEVPSEAHLWRSIVNFAKDLPPKPGQC